MSRIRTDRGRTREIGRQSKKVDGVCGDDSLREDGKRTVGLKERVLG